MLLDCIVLSTKEERDNMIRSLVAPANISLDETFTPRRNLTQEQIEASVENGDTFWIDMVDAEEEEITWLEHLLNLHPTVVQDLRREDRRPTLLVYPNYIFLSLFQPAVRLHHIYGKEIHCLIGERFFVTVRTSSSSAVEEAYERVAKNHDSWRRGIAYFLYITTQFVVDAYYPLLDRISEQLNRIEETILEGKGKVDSISQNTIYRIKHQLIALRQMVAPQREVLASVMGEERLIENAVNRDLFRHLYERLLRVYDVIDSQRDLSSNVLDLQQSQESARLADAVGRLTILSMIFLPLTFFIGLFELNFATTIDQLVIPVSGKVLFILVVGMMIGSALLLVWLFRRNKWI